MTNIEDKHGNARTLHACTHHMQPIACSLTCAHHRQDGQSKTCRAQVGVGKFAHPPPAWCHTLGCESVLASCCFRCDRRVAPVGYASECRCCNTRAQFASSLIQSDNC
eukprot:2977319-Amphidinium_carterae.1